MYGLFLAETQGAHYHYYDHELNPPASSLAKASWLAAQALESAGLLKFAVIDEF